MSHTSVLIAVNVIGFQLLWFAAVAGSTEGVAWLAWPVLISMVVMQASLSGQWRRDRVALQLGAVSCLLLEPLWLGTELLVYRDWPHSLIAPHWIWALWLGLVVSLHYGFAWLKRHLFWAAVLGAVAGMCSLRLGVALGAATVPAGWWPMAIAYAITWAMALPILSFLVDRWPAHRGNYV